MSTGNKRRQEGKANKQIKHILLGTNIVGLFISARDSSHHKYNNVIETMDSKNIKPLLAPSTMTMERVGETKQLIVAQSTSQCCRTGCCQPSINWVLREADK